MPNKKFLYLTDEYDNDVIVSTEDVVSVRRCRTNTTQLTLINGCKLYVTQQPSSIAEYIRCQLEH